MAKGENICGNSNDLCFMYIDKINGASTQDLTILILFDFGQLHINKKGIFPAAMSETHVSQPRTFLKRSDMS